MTIHPLLRRRVQNRSALAQRSRHRLPRWLGTLAFGLLTSAAMAQGQAAGTNPAPEGLRRAQERATQVARPLATAPDALVPPPAGSPPAPDTIGPALLVDESPCFVVHQLALQGNDTGGLPWLQAPLQTLAGHCLGVQSLQRITQALNQQLLAQGLITSRVTLPQQNIASGRVHWQLHLGRIEAVHLVVHAGDGHPAGANTRDDTRWGTWRNAFPVRAGQVLNIRDIEQGIEQMKRVPSQDVNTRIEPGSAPDTSVLVIERSLGPPDQQGPRRVRGNASLDNLGTHALGTAQVAANLAIDQLLGLNDITSVSLSSNAQDPWTGHRSQSGQISLSLPWGYHLFTASASHARFGQRIALTTTQVLSTGSSDTRSLQWQHAALRAASWKATLEATLAQRSSRSFLDDSENLVSRRQTTQLTLGASWRRLLDETGTLDANLSYQRGVPWLQAEPELPAGPGVPSLRAGVWRAGLQWQQSAQVLGRPWQLSSGLRGQHSAQTTLSVDQLALGGPGSVRGFDGESVLIAESGWLWRNELSTPLPWLPQTQTSVYLALDAGRVWGPSAARLAGHGLAGAALGLRVNAGPWGLDTSLGGPLLRPAGFKTAPLHLTLNANRSL